MPARSRRAPAPRARRQVRRAARARPKARARAAGAGAGPGRPGPRRSTCRQVCARARAGGAPVGPDPRRVEREAVGAPGWHLPGPVCAGPPGAGRRGRTRRPRAGDAWRRACSGAPPLPALRPRPRRGRARRGDWDPHQVQTANLSRSLEGGLRVKAFRGTVDRANVSLPPNPAGRHFLICERGSSSLLTLSAVLL